MIRGRQSGEDKVDTERFLPSFLRVCRSEVCNQEELALGAVVANWSDPEAPAVLINLSFDYRAVVNQCQWLVVGK